MFEIDIVNSNLSTVLTSESDNWLYVHANTWYRQKQNEMYFIM